MHLLASPAISSEALVTSAHATDKYIAVGDEYGKVHVVTVEEASVRMFDDQEGAVWAVCVSGEWLLSGGVDGVLRVWDIGAGTLTHTLHSHSTLISAITTIPQHSSPLQPTPNHTLILSADKSGTIHIWSLSTSTATHLRTLSGHTHKVPYLHIPASPNNTNNHPPLLVSGSYDGTARIWDLNSGACKYVLEGHEGPLFAVESWCGESEEKGKGRVFTAGMDGTVRVWSLDDGSPLTILHGHTGAVNSLTTTTTTSPHPLLLSAGIDGYVRVWCLDTYAQLCAVNAHGKAVTAFAVWKEWSVSGGKEGGVPEDVCGIDAQVVVWGLQEAVRGSGDGGRDGGEGVEGRREGVEVLVKSGEQCHQAALNDEETEPEKKDPARSAVGETEVKVGKEISPIQLGTRAQSVSRIRIAGDKLAVVAWKRGKAIVEIWET